MARSITPSSPDKLFPKPFVEVSLKMSEVMKYYHKGDVIAGTQMNYPFAVLVAVLSYFGKGIRMVSGDSYALGKIIALINRNMLGEALEHFQGMEPFEISLPWATPWSNPYSGVFGKIQQVYGANIHQMVLGLFQGNTGNLIYQPWLASGDVSTRLTITIAPGTGASPVLIYLRSVDVWFTKLDQGMRIGCVDRKIEDLSDSPMTPEALATISPSHAGYYCGGSFISLRSLSDKLTLAQNFMYNAALTYTGLCFNEVYNYPTRKDTIFTRMRSNIPIGALVGGTLLAASPLSQPVLSVHGPPCELYNLLRDKLPEGRKLRQGGIHAAPSRAARAAGTAANLSLVGKSTKTSRHRKSLGYLLYDRDSAESIKEALDAGDGVFAGHDLFTDYLEWYHEMRTVASRISTKIGEPVPKWGKWGFKPFEFAGMPMNAELFIKILPEDA